MKNMTAFLIPYFFKGNDLFVLLQRRTTNDPRLANQLAAFGGKLQENESYEEGLVREIKEELGYVTKNYTKLGIFEDDFAKSTAYIENVPKNFDELITVHEGEKAEWHKAAEVITRNDLHQKTCNVITVMLEKLIN